MIEYIEINKIHGAEYNPRIISDDQFSELVRSIKEIGFVLPIIVNRRNNTIIAGHQRSKAARAAGITTVPCLFCDDIAVGDEVKFNQLHNYTDTHDCIAHGKRYAPGFHQIPSEEFTVTDSNATQLQEICKLLNKYGNLLCAVMCKGDILIGARYVKACQLLRFPVNISIVDESVYEKAKAYMLNPTTSHITERLKAELEKTSSLSAFSIDLYDRIATSTLIGKDEAVSLMLKNGQVIGKDEQNANGDQTSHDYPRKA
jgi:hypothetical protein